MTPRSRPDPRPMRVIFGVAGLAAASAMLTAVALPSAAAQTAVTLVGDTAVTPVRHVLRYVQLLPGQTAPPNAVVESVPQPTPRVVVVTTHQSGKK